MQIIPRSSFKSAPWKNGGGITHEVLREPAGVEHYRWRVSVAEIAVAGPFSSFPNYQRTMVLLDGGGVRLTFAGGRQCYLREPGDLMRFEGAEPAECELLAGPCMDLNLIVCNAITRVVTQVEEPQAPCSIVPGSGQTTLVFAVRGSFALANGGSISRLQQWDMAVVAAGDAVALVANRPVASPAPLVFLATVDDND